MLSLLWPVLARADDFQSWTGLFVQQTLDAKTSVTWRAEPRFTDDASYLGTVFLRAAVARTYNRSTKWTADLTYIDARSEDPVTGDTRHGEQFWVGGGHTSRWWLSEQWGVALRQSLRARWLDGQDSPNIVSRHYGEVAWRPTRPGYFQGVYAGAEGFVEYANDTRPEYRLTPFGVRLRPTEHTSLSVFYLIRARKYGSDWRRANVIGTYLTWRI